MINAFKRCITFRCTVCGISIVFEISTEKDILTSPSCPNGVPSCSEKRFSWSFRNQLRLKDGNPNCRNNSWKQHEKPMSTSKHNFCPITAALNRTHLYSSYTSCFGSEVSGCSSKWFRIQLNAYICWVRLDDMEFWSLQEKQRKRKALKRDAVAAESCVYNCCSCIIYHVTSYLNFFPFDIVKVVVP